MIRRRMPRLWRPSWYALARWVVLALPVACGPAPSAEPDAPAQCVQVGGITNNRNTVAVLECDRAPDPLPGGWCKPAESGWACCYPSVPGGCE